MKKIKILRIIARLNIGGPAIHTVLLSEGLDKEKFESLLVSGAIDKSEGDMLYYAREKQVQPYFIPELTRKISLYNDAIAFLKIYSLISRFKPDIIHTHTAKAGTIGRSAGILYNFLHFYRKNKIKLIHTFHGHVFDGYFNKITTAVFLGIEKFLAYFTDVIITVGDILKVELAGLGIAKSNKIRVIPLGFELEKFLDTSCLDREVSKIGIVGRLVPIKNHRLFLEAAAQIMWYNPDIKIRFCVVGDGELRQDLEEYAQQLKISGQVDFTGWEKDLKEVYAGLDIICLTSINEGTPVSLIEAMASARPVAATNVGAVQDLLGKESAAVTSVNFKVLERGVLVNSVNAVDFSQALLFLIGDKQLRLKMGQNGREFAQKKFSKERLVSDIEKLYQEAIGT